MSELLSKKSWDLCDLKTRIEEEEGVVTIEDTLSREDFNDFTSKFLSEICDSYMWIFCTEFQLCFWFQLKNLISESSFNIIILKIKWKTF